MPYPISYSFELEAGPSGRDRVLEAFESAAREVAMDVVERSPGRLVLSSGLSRALGYHCPPMCSATRCELTFFERGGVTWLRVQARFTQLAVLGVALPSLAWLMIMIATGGQGALHAAARLAATVPAVWLVFYLVGMLDVRAWTRGASYK